MRLWGLLKASEECGFCFSKQSTHYFSGRKVCLAFCACHFSHTVWLWRTPFPSSPSHKYRILSEFYNCTILCKWVLGTKRSEKTETNMDSLPPTLHTWTSFLRNGFYLREYDACNTVHTTVKLYYNRAGLRAALESKQRKTKTNKDSPPCSVVSKSPSFILVLRPESWASLPVFVDPAHSIVSLFILPLGQSQSIKRKENHETHY